MRTNTYIRVMALWAVVMSMACSKIGFSPTDPEYSPNGTLSKTETFIFNKNDTTAKVDILIIDDNSTSMLPAQEKFGSSLDSFLNSIGNIDWQIGITTTDVSSPKYGIKGSLIPFSNGSRILTKNTPNYREEFENTMVRPETASCINDPNDCPSSDERAMEAIVLAMQKRSSTNAGFFRTGADLVVIVLTNEDEGSIGTSTPPQAPLVQPLAVIAAAKLYFGANKSFTGFGIMIEPGDTACYNSMKAFGAHYSTFAKDFATLSGGESGSICDLDYGSTLASIGQRVLQGIKSITLKYTPTNPDEIIVNISPADPTLTWTLEGRQITFNKAPAQNTKVDVIYTH